MKLKTTELKRFFANASLIRSKGILPILDFILIKDNKIIKTNLEAYIEMDITPTGETMLLDENILSRLLKITTSDEIRVEKTKARVYLRDGVNNPYFTLPDDASLYPESPNKEDEPAEEVVLNENVLKSIGVASKNTAQGDVITPAFNFVNLSDNYIFASDHFRFYLKKFDSLPTVAISSLCASIISQFGTATYFKRNNFDFFRIGTILYGFAGQEVKPPNFAAFLPFITKDEYMEVNVEEVLNFLDLLSGSTPSQTTTCDFDGNKLSFFDVDLSVGNDIELNVVGDYRPNKSFLPRIVAPFFKSIGKDTLRISPMKDGRKGITVWTQEEPDFIGMIGETNDQK